MQHDAAACALAEHAWRGWRGCHCLIYLTCGTGFGAGIVIDGMAHHGARGHSIELGHARYAEAHPHAREICRLQPATLGGRVQDLSALVVAVNAEAKARKENRQ